MEYHRFRAMNSDLILAAEGDSELVATGFELAQSYIANSEARFSRFLPESELSRLNRQAGNWFYASPDLFEILELAQNSYGMTNGLFNPAILKALEHAGYDRSMDEIRGGGVVRADNREKICVPDFGTVQLEASSRGVLLPTGMQVDLGGIAKGWIAEQAAQKLSLFANTCAVSAGGDMVLAGLPEREQAWEVDLEDPLDPDQTLAILKVGPGAVATSAVTKRRWKQGQRMQHHLIDPRTGMPAKTDWLSVTVIATSAAIAEVFAKAMLIAGSMGVTELSQPKGLIAYVSVDSKGKLWGSNNIWEYLDVRNEFISA
jgi:thiamine biosynthesis lipoprotein